MITATLTTTTTVTIHDVQVANSKPRSFIEAPQRRVAAAAAAAAAALEEV